MIFIVVSLISFIFTVLVHILFHRWLIEKGRATVKIFSVFLFGFILNAFLILFLFHNGNWRSIPLPMTSVALYGLFSLTYIIFFASPFLGDESPSSKILLLVKKSGKMSFEGIKDNFSDEKLILKRLKDMARANLIEEKGESKKRYRILPKGQKIAMFVIFYRRLMSYNLVG